MSRHPSPGPSHSGPQISPQASSAPSRRTRPAPPVGIAAGAEDVKYQAKYKDLKRKVKEIEGDNDKLQFKVLQAKRSLQRMKLERAILYERLSSTSPPHQNRDNTRDRTVTVDSDPPLVDYLRQRDQPRPMDPPPLATTVVPEPHMSAVQSPRRNSASHDTSRHLPPLPHLPQVGQYDSAARSHSLPQPSSPHAHPNSSAPHDRARSQSSRPYPPVPGQQYPENLPGVQRVLHSPPPHPDRERPSRRIEGTDYPPPHNESHLQHPRHPSQLSPHLHPADARTPSSRPAHQRYVSREEPLPRQYDIEREKPRERDSRGDWERDTRRHEPSNSRENIHSPHTTHRRPQQPSEYQDHPPHSHHSLSQPPQNLPLRLREDVYYHEGNPYPSVHASRSDTPGSGSAGSGIGAGESPSRPDSRTQFYEQQDRDRQPSYRLRPVSQSNNNNNNEDVKFVGHDDVRSQSRDALPPPRPSSTPTATAARGANSTSTPSGPNNGTSGSNILTGGGGGSVYTHLPGSGLTHPSGTSERGQTPSRIENSRKRSRNDTEMDVDSDNGGVAADTRSRRDSPGPAPRYSGIPGPAGEERERDRDRDRGSSKRYQRDHPHHRNVGVADNREGSPAPPSGPPSDQHQDSRMTSS